MVQAARYLSATQWWREGLGVIEGSLGPTHADTAACLNNLALLLWELGDLAGARPLFERALAIREKALGPEHPDTAKSLNNLAGLLRNQGDLAGARPLYERALAIREKALGPEHPRYRDEPQQPRRPAIKTRATSPARGRSTSARWRSARRRSAPSIPRPR